MAGDDTIQCPAVDCSETGALSSIIHHITSTESDSHTWQAIGYTNSYAFRQARTTDTDDGGGNSEPTCESDVLDNQEIDESLSLEEVPGIGETRSAAFREAGYDRAIDVANAEIGDLATVSSVSHTSAKAIQAAAQEACGCSETFISELADAVGVSRKTAMEAYSTLASASVPPSIAEPSLREYFDHEEGSVMVMEEWSFRYRHFLYEAGFKQLEDIVNASHAELTESRYIGDARAAAIQQSASKLAEPSTTTADNDNLKESTNKQENKDDKSAPQTGAAGSPDQQESPSDQATGSMAEGTEGRKVDGEFPQAMREADQWLLWKQTDDGRKIPRAPWASGDPMLYASAKDPENWTSFETANKWRRMLPHDLELAFFVTHEDDFIFIDLDDVVVDGTPTEPAQELIEKAETYTAISTSGEGIHLLGQGNLSENIKTLTGRLTSDSQQSLEVYDRDRFIAMTGNSLSETPASINPVPAFIAELENDFASVSSATPDRATSTPKRTRSEIQDLETTTDIQDIFDAISQTRPSDIIMKSTETKAHSDGTYSYDPSWVHSESGTRLGVLDDVWIYRKGMVALDALQLVALEEKIITDERAYPEDTQFWDAVGALRDRGAHIPKYEPEGEYEEDSTPSSPEAEIEFDEVTKRLNYGDPVRGYVHPDDRDYQERLALKLAPVLIEGAEALSLGPAVAYRTAEAYAAGHAAGMVPGSSHETTLGAALRIASIEAGTPRPLKTIASEFDTTQTSVNRKASRLKKETNILEAFDASDLLVDPIEYVPYVARQLGIYADDAVLTQVRELLETADVQSGTSPLSPVGGAFYVVLKDSPEYTITQRQIGDAADVTEVTIRNNYKQFTQYL